MKNITVLDPNPEIDDFSVCLGIYLFSHWIREKMEINVMWINEATNGYISHSLLLQNIKNQPCVQPSC